MSMLQKLLKKIDDLKPMPAVVSKIMAIVQDPDCDLSAVGDIINHDPIITANLLKTCNSAYYALPNKIESAHEAVKFLGMDKIVDMVLLKSTTENLSNEQKGYGLHEGELCKHAMASALIAEELAKKVNIKNKHQIFTAALIKDIGKVILDRNLENSFDKINKLVTKDGLSFMDAEKAIMGIDHAELGAIVAKKWDFSQEMINIIRNHHLPDLNASEGIETAIVYTADNVCMMLGIGVGTDGLAYRFQRKIMEALNITALELQKMIADFGEKIEGVEAMVADK